jgi:hypothetical protein
VGMYWTWGKDEKKAAAGAPFFAGQMNKNGL